MISKRRVFYFLGTIVLVKILLSCILLLRPFSISDVPGTYVRYVGGMSDEINLHADGTFTQTIKASTDTQWIANGTWSLTERALNLEESYHIVDIYGHIDIPPKKVGMMTLGAERGRLSREREPEWNRIQ